MKSTNKNFLYNLIYQIFIFVVPLVTTPYISRVLGAENIGKFAFTYSIVSYFMLGSMLGINNYGSREIAKASNDMSKRSKKFFEIYYLQVFSGALMLIFYSVLVLFIGAEYRQIMLLQVINLIACLVDINWFYFGMEKFKITISRNIIIKLASLVLIFLLVKNRNDLWIYTLILSASVLISQLYLWLFIKKDIQKVRVTFSGVFSHLKQCLILFIPIIAYSVYRIMDKTMIGSMVNEVELGNYESAEKVINIPVGIVTALGTVMMPHMSKISEDKFFDKIVETFRILFFILMPLIIGVIIISHDFSTVFFGEEYTITPEIIKYLIFSVLFAGIANVIRNSYLIPKNEDKTYVKSTTYGAVVNLIVNILLIPSMGAYGATIGTLIAECSVMTYQIIKTIEKINYIKIFKNVIEFVIKSIVMGVLIYLIGLLISNIYIRLLVQIVIGGISYIILNWRFLKQEFLSRNKTTKTEEEKVKFSTEKDRLEYMKYIIDQDYNHLAYINVKAMDEETLEKIINYTFSKVYYLKQEDPSIDFDYEQFKNSEISSYPYFTLCMSYMNKKN